MTIVQRVKAPKPLFFRRVQRTAFFFSLLCLGVLALWPARLPAFVQVVAACGYAASVSAASLCQLTTGGKHNKSKSNGKFITKRP